MMFCHGAKQPWIVSLLPYKLIILSILPQQWKADKKHIYSLKHNI
jgi:hypothetical protein